MIKEVADQLAVTLQRNPPALVTEAKQGRDRRAGKRTSAVQRTLPGVRNINVIPHLLSALDEQQEVLERLNSCSTTDDCECEWQH